MATLNLLYRDIISSGWTREARKQLAPLLKGKSSDELISLFKQFKDRGLSPTPSLNSKHPAVELVRTPERINKYYQELMKNMESLRSEMEMYDAWEITKKSAREFSEQEKSIKIYVGKDAQTDDRVSDVLRKTSELNNSYDFHKFMGFMCEKLGIQQKSFKFSDIIRTNKRTGTSATLQADKSFVSELLTAKDKESFVKGVQRGFNMEGTSFHDCLVDNFDQCLNYAIKKDNETIGYYSLGVADATLTICNYTIFPEFRGSKASLNSILELRDNAAKIAKEKSCLYIKVDVDSKNPELLSLYRRFGFKENYVKTMDYVNDHGIPIQTKSYNLYHYIRKS